MISFCKAAFHTLKVFVLFVACTIFFYYGMMWLNEEYQNYHRYDEPKGTAVKVSAPAQTADSGWFHRLLLFYMNGE